MERDPRPVDRPGEPLSRMTADAHPASWVTSPTAWLLLPTAGEHELPDRPRVPGDLPSDAVRVGEVAGVAAPVALDRVTDLGAGPLCVVEHGIDLRTCADVVRQGERRYAGAAADGSDLGLEVGL